MITQPKYSMIQMSRTFLGCFLAAALLLLSRAQRSIVYFVLENGLLIKS